MEASIPHTIHHNTFWLSSERCIFWEEKKALIIADLHLGKTGHFRKAGIAVPQAVFKEDLHRLFALIQHYRPEQLIVVGDMFHSKANKEIDFFFRWRADLSYLQIHLIKGNHDILQEDWYEKACIKITTQQSVIDKFCFVHDINEIKPEELQESYFFSGHIHPGINVKSRSRQSLSFPCYYFSQQYAVLPAFSKFTGFVTIKPKRSDTIYAIVNQSLVQLQ